jgi:hypothetical protein
MTAAERTSLRSAAVFCGALGLCSTIYVILILSRGLVIASLSDVLFPDLLVFYAAARAFFAGKLALVYDIDAFTQYQNALLADRFPRPLHFRPFFYPPTWLLMLLPFGLLGVAGAYSAFMSLTAAGATALVGRRDWWGGSPLSRCPPWYGSCWRAKTRSSASHCSTAAFDCSTAHLRSPESCSAC